MVHTDSGESLCQAVYQAAAVDRSWLVKQLTEAILAALPQVAAANSLPELVHVSTPRGCLPG